ncbi:atypical/ABC1/ABC1-C protein kinase [Spizellomyces punctatus DAOM BR117]|uniref:Atypical/ABC1/ABC1-C protein kinase n=1 Tax=Spizellomyces punctatus (strain DAOM BR117) TaxID=645134 RepID=A0A0L0HCN1_SPIPD|nr:atypical/ABC1/ABC1-C protein kinase [Spizellomyces punctatus DAOM BR117]KNC98649.1 atypical/ABC1/ABC1-C protein kinase [Spizellomyces punctatus DAOM BR117]|eukprot:XP_016606689.1 atypical/ABC1/ABC1-C protein kinase [Spizellomyces punctatus DAOM BR117]
MRMGFGELGQWTSSRTDLIPPEICAVFARLQNRVTPHPFSATRSAVQALYNNVPLDDIFIEFDVDPIGVGAVAQVHRAVLNPTDTSPPIECAIKVLHPNVEEQVSIDLALLAAFGAFLNLFPAAKYLSIPEEIATFDHMMRDQMDMTIEARNLDIFRENFEGQDEKGRRRGVANVTFPKPLKASRRVLVETFHHGLLLRSLLDNGPTPYDAQLALIGVSAFMQMILKDNFYHCDLHPGNILITFSRTPSSPSMAQKAGAWLTTKIDPTKDAKTQSLFHPQTLARDALDNLARAPSDAWKSILQRMVNEGYEPQVVLLDAGIVSSLSPKNMDNVKESFRAGLEYDGARIAELLLTRCKDPDNVRDPEGAKETLRVIMDDLKMDAGGRLPLSRIHTAKVIARVATLLRDHRIGLDGEFVGLFVCSVIIEGVGRKLDADMDLLEPLAEYL